MPVHLQCALSTMEGARKKQESQNSHHFPNVHFQVKFLKANSSDCTDHVRRMPVQCKPSFLLLGYLWIKVTVRGDNTLYIFDVCTTKQNGGRLTRNLWTGAKCKLSLS